MDTFEMADLIAARKELGERYLEFFTAETGTLAWDCMYCLPGTRTHSSRIRRMKSIMW